MKDSVIIGFIVALWNKLLEIYNDCFIEKIIRSICNFFKEKSKGSAVCAIFKNRFLHGSYWRNSALFKIVTAPVRFLKFIAQKEGDKLIAIREGSEFLKIFDNLLYIPLREYGILTSTYTVGVLLTSAVFAGLTKLRMIMIAVMFFVDVILLLVPCSIRLLGRSSVIAKAVKSIFNDSDKV